MDEHTKRLAVLGGVGAGLGLLYLMFKGSPSQGQSTPTADTTGTATAYSSGGLIYVPTSQTDYYFNSNNNNSVSNSNNQSNSGNTSTNTSTVTNPARPVALPGGSTSGVPTIHPPAAAPVHTAPAAAPPVLTTTNQVTTPTGYINNYWQNVKSDGGAYADPAKNGMTVQQQVAHEAALYGISPSEVKVETNAQGQARTFVPWNLVQSHAIMASAN